MSVRDFPNRELNAGEWMGDGERLNPKKSRLRGEKEKVWYFRLTQHRHQSNKRGGENTLYHCCMVFWLLSLFAPVVHTPFLMGYRGKNGFQYERWKIWKAKRKLVHIWKNTFLALLFALHCSLMGMCVILDYNLSFYGFGEIIMSMLRSQRDDNEKVLSAVIFLVSLCRPLLMWTVHVLTSTIAQFGGA